MHRKTWIATLLLLLMTPAGCGDNLGEPPPEPPAEPEITYWQNAAPIFFQYCVNCHKEDGVAPFRLDSYAEAREWAPVIRQAVEERVMPPWTVVSDGSCGEYHDPQWLDDAEIETIAAWVELGAPEGTPRTDLTTPPRGPELDDGTGEIITVASPEFLPELQDDVPFAEWDEYRCFLYDPGLERDRFITGYEVVPGHDTLVHHAQIMVVDPSVEIEPGLTNGDLMRQYDEESPDRAGWPCFGFVGDRVTVESFPIQAAAGQGVTVLPHDSGARVKAGHVFVLQVHYYMADEALRGKPVRTEIAVRMADEVEREGYFAMPDALVDSVFTGNPVALEPGKERVPFSYEVPAEVFLDLFGIEYFDVYGVLPHMHHHGRRFSYDIVDANGEVQCGARVERWDTDWQYFYFYEKPLKLPAGSTIRATCEYDTRDRTEPLTGGWGAEYEMCMTGLYLIVP